MAEHNLLFEERFVRAITDIRPFVPDWASDIDRPAEPTNEPMMDNSETGGQDDTTSPTQNVEAVQDGQSDLSGSSSLPEADVAESRDEDLANRFTTKKTLRKADDVPVDPSELGNILQPRSALVPEEVLSKWLGVEIVACDVDDLLACLVPEMGGTNVPTQWTK